jgi:hypothetical protein
MVDVGELHQALFQAVLASYHDYYGSLQADSALRLLDRLEIRADLEHHQQLRAVLMAGNVNHYRSPHAWNPTASTKG